ncbi:hypothetical protein BDA99DRAFT_229227 [Phascolomyces articulosus]|uniref:F-box domain-containing protein n=1 Tax=Phascolomyces articulosus TaxID=60185 RepID=A0AAD5JQ94_9FUNG|nr:hypothetical protein BDA99DRAFT_229227 [Phascolomyces articulosus]
MPRHHDYHVAMTTHPVHLVENDHHYHRTPKSTSDIMTTQCPDHNGIMTHTNSSFVDVLPFELVSAIFSMLTMEQNVCCTQVCHAWRSFILYSWGGLWHELSDDNCNFVHDLVSYPISGQHVKILHMNARKRRKQSQEIKFLVSHHCCHIQAVHLNSGLSKQNFLKLVRLIGSHLKMLDLRNQASPSPDIVLNAILRDCSNLNHLTFYTAHRYTTTVLEEEENNNINSNSNDNNKRKWNFLQHYRHPRLMSMALYMHGRTSNLPLHQLLLSLPQLQRISMNPYDFPDANDTLSSLYRFAPMLETIHYGHDLKSWTTAMTTIDRASSLSIPSSIITAPTTTTDDTSTLRHLHLSELDTNIQERNVIPFISKNNNTLELLDFKFIPNLSNETIYNLTLFQFPQLKSLTLGMNNNNYTDDEDIMTMEDADEEDYLVLTTNNSNSSRRRYEHATTTLVDNLSNFLRQSAPNLEELYLYNLTAANDLFFQTVASHLHHLHTFTVAFCDHVSSESILLFIQHYSTFTNGDLSTAPRYPYLKRLSLQGMDAVNDTVMQQLGITMKHHLEVLDVSECQNITDVGLQSFVDYHYDRNVIATTAPTTPSSPSSKPTIIQQNITLKDLYIWGCFSVTSECYQYVQDQLSRQGTTVRYNLF